MYSFSCMLYKTAAVFGIIKAKGNTIRTILVFWSYYNHNMAAGNKQVKTSALIFLADWGIGNKIRLMVIMCQIMYKWILKKKGILNKREYLGPVWPADVWSANDIPFCSIFTYFQYSLIHDLAQNAMGFFISVFSFSLPSKDKITLYRSCTNNSLSLDNK